ncbi:hypothetical protein SFC43_13360 [Bacteroides sp. CR5/BHMF/2]|nr:hypothetical protein [Bacteroides sp. CR5/BHMF/2]
MAKQIKPEEDITIAQEPATTTATNETKSQTETKDQAKPEAHILSVLQAFPAYEQLYVDKQGGIYTLTHLKVCAAWQPCTRTLISPNLNSLFPC